MTQGSVFMQHLNPSPLEWIIKKILSHSYRTDVMTGMIYLEISIHLKPTRHYYLQL